jgi:predicted membrane protein
MTHNQRLLSVVLLIGSLNILVLAVIYSKWLTVVSMVLLAMAILLYLYTDRRS